jgi:hypothetical protein
VKHSSQIRKLESAVPFQSAKQTVQKRPRRRDGKAQREFITPWGKKESGFAPDAAISQGNERWL